MLIRCLGSDRILIYIASVLHLLLASDKLFLTMRIPRAPNIPDCRSTLLILVLNFSRKGMLWCRFFSGLKVNSITTIIYED